MACAECGGNHATGMCSTYAKVGDDTIAPTPKKAAHGDAERIPLGEGDRLGNFWLTKKLGTGTSSEVFLGENELTQARIAIKVLRPELHSDAEMVRRFESEARTTNMVRHEHVVEINDIGIHSGWQHYIQLEHLDGPTLGQLLQQRMDIVDALRISLQLCAALGAAHQKGVVHRDLKPANVFVLKRDGQHHAKLVDFGMARREKLDDGESRTRFGTIVGTAHFMSPEQVLGGDIDGRSDTYSLGVLLFQMVTGKLPFDGDHPIAVMMAHQKQEPPSPRDLEPRVSVELEDVILRCLAKKPNDRWPKMEDLGRALAGAMRGEKPQLALGASPVSPSRVGPVIVAPFAASPQMTIPPNEPPARRQPRIPTSFGVTVSVGKETLGNALVADISMGGAFIRTNLTLPLFSRCKVAGTTPKGALDVTGEVVRLSQDPSRPGFGMRFDTLAPAQRTLLEALHRERTGEAPGSGDPKAEAQLKQFEARPANDFYAQLGVPRDAPTRVVRDVCERLASETAANRFPTLSPGQASRLDALRLRITEAEEVLIDPRRRALYDAVNGNVLGVLRCITEGLSLDSLGQLRKDFLKVQPDAEKKAKPAVDRANAALARGEFSASLQAIADAISIDPLNLALHRKAVEVRQQRAKPETLPPPV
jgi:eukaryotic-like serine/threonine-protein kinase